MNKKVLLVCYSFPPFPGIGGRRWAKFAKYFAAEGIECHVINAHNFSKNQSLWTKDIENPNITIHSIKFRFQYWMGLYSSGFLYRLCSKILRTVINFTKYSPYFSTSLSKDILQKNCIRILEKYKIDTVIASGDPYLHLNISELKKTCDIRVILDYRDLWNDFYRYNTDTHHKLTIKQRRFFEHSEMESLKNCDQVVCVYEPMIAPLSARSGREIEHFQIIPNGFDEDDYTNLKPSESIDETCILYFGGNVALAAKYLIDFLKSYSALRNIDLALWSQFKIVLNGDSPAYFDQELKKLSDPNIIFEKIFLSGREYREKLNSSRFGILSYPDEYIDCFFITKTFDYFYLEKPIIYLGKRGKVSEFIESNGIGFSLHPGENSELFFRKLLNMRVHFQYPQKIREIILEEYSIKRLSLKYLTLLNKY